MQVNANKVGLVFGAILGGWHVVWSLLVFVGWGQPLIDFVLWAHMVYVPYLVESFDPLASLTLIVLTAVLGYVVGCIIATAWNRVHR